MRSRQAPAQGDAIFWRAKLHLWRGQRVVGYGAPAKATVWLNWIGVTNEISYVVDSTPEKQGKWIPGVGIPIREPAVLEHDIMFGYAADVVIVFCHNYLEEVLAKIPEGPEVWTSLGERLR